MGLAGRAKEGSLNSDFNLDNRIGSSWGIEYLAMDAWVPCGHRPCQDDRGRGR